MELDSQGLFHTWCGTSTRGIVFSKLDRAFCNEDFLYSWAQVSSLCLHRTCSDHHRLLLDCASNSRQPSWPFRFLEMWTHHDSFMDLVKEVWGESSSGSASFVLCHNLKLLRACLKI